MRGEGWIDGSVLKNNACGAREMVEWLSYGARTYSSCKRPTRNSHLTHGG